MWSSFRVSLCFCCWEDSVKEVSENPSSESLNCFCLGYIKHLHCLFQVRSTVQIFKGTVVQCKAANEYIHECCLIKTIIATSLFIFLWHHYKTMYRFVTPLPLTYFIFVKCRTWGGPVPSADTVFFQQFERNKTKQKREWTFSEYFLTTKLVLLYGSTLFGCLIWNNTTDILEGYVSFFLS